MTRRIALSCLFLALCVAAAPPVSADSYLVYGQSGIPQPSNLFTWCDTPPCDVAGMVTCDTPEGGAAIRQNTNVWGGWGVFLGQPVDLSAYEGGQLKFFARSPADLKVEFQCNEGVPASTVTYTRFISQHGWNGTNTWQEISIPICDFFPGGTCKPECLASVKAPYMNTIENLPFFNSFRIDHVRWHKESTHSGASSVEVQGRQLMVNGEPFVVNGVAYSPISIGENWTAAWKDRPDRYLVDFPLIAASGANTVRLYAPILSTALLDAAWASGLYVIPTFQPDSAQLTCANGRAYMQDRLLEMVEEWGDHPAILMWVIGNEFNMGLTTVDLCQSWYPQLDALAAAVHAAEGASSHPVSTANADTAGLSDICMAGCSDDTTLPNLDLWSVQLYRGCSFGTAFDEYQKADCERPLIVTEFGVDAWDSQMGIENETLQGTCIQSLLDEADEALAVRTPGGVSSGQVVFEWSDEWWKAECDPGTAWNTHDTCTSSENFGYPDPGINEEWWGITGQVAGDPAARVTRDAHDRMSDAWTLGAACNLDIDTFDRTTGDTSVSFAPGAGSTDHTIYYGPLSAVSTYGYTGSFTGIGGQGSGAVTLPEGDLFWLVAAKSNGAEGCYGTDSAGSERACFPDGNCSVAQATPRNCECGGL